MEDSDIWIPSYGQDRPIGLHPSTTSISTTSNPQALTNNLALASSSHIDFNFPFHVSAHIPATLPTSHPPPPPTSVSDAHNRDADRTAVHFRDTMLHTAPFVATEASSLPHQTNVLTNIPFPPYFGISDIDYHFEPMPLGENIGNSSLVYKDMEPKTLMYNTPGVNAENLLNHINPVFPYPMTSIDSAPQMSNPIKNDNYNKNNPGSSKTNIGTAGLRIPLHCQVCQATQANGLHFGARTCAACAAFFRRTVSDDKKYSCKRNQRCNNASKDGSGYRKICRACRLKRCLDIGMLPENVQHKRTRNESPTSSNFTFEAPKPITTYESRHFESHNPFYS